jgi:hypothetical protein
MQKVILRKIKTQLPKILLYRILGNDLPPRHKRGQTYENLEFILKYEPNFPNCRKKWIINRIFDRKVERKIVKLLEKYRQSYIRIPFVLDEYKSKILRKIKIVDNEIPRDIKSLTIMDLIRYKKISYITNLNAARNRALSDGIRLADWIFPFDGNCCFNKRGLQSVIDKLSIQKSTNKCFVVPMYRVKSNKQYFNFTCKGYKEQEPQIIFGKDSNFKFNVSYIYGSLPKVELLQRLKFRLRRTEHGIMVDDSKIKCGYVLRLSSGAKLEDKLMGIRGSLREESLDSIFKKIDKYISTGKKYANNY